MATLARIVIYPIKSLDPVELAQANVLPNGALEFDRRWALFDGEDRAVTAKRFARIQRVRATYDLPARVVRLALDSEEGADSFHLDEDREALAAWLAARLGISAAVLRESDRGGFPDDEEFPGPTVISTATLRGVAEWFPGLDVDESRRRFRANLELEADEPFWEERLYSEKGLAVPFQVGAVPFEGTNPCQRCIVPTRWSQTGEKTPDFTRIFEERRFETLPPWSTRSRFDHFYRLAVNTTHAARTGGTIHVGDPVQTP